MGYKENTTVKKRKTPNLLERLRIECFFKEHLKPVEIAQRLERNRRTIERELVTGMLELEGPIKTR